MRVKYSVLGFRETGAYNAFRERDLQGGIQESRRMGFGCDYEGQVHLGITAIIVQQRAREGSSGGSPDGPSGLEYGCGLLATKFFERGEREDEPEAKLRIDAEFTSRGK